MNAVAKLEKTSLSALRDPRLFREFAYVDGAWVAGASGTAIDVTDPADGRRIGAVPALSAGDVETAIAAAHRAFGSWSAKLPQERATVLRRWFELVSAAREDLARLMVEEQGKPLSEARGEIDYAASFIEFYAEEAKRLNVESVTSHLPGAEMTVIRQPAGVAALVTPWNFPAAMLTRKAAAALAAGCTAFADCDFERAVERAVAAKFATSGQDCLAANRFYVERPIYARFVAAFAERVARLTVGPGLADPDIGPLINARAVAKQREHVADALARGARLMAGGEPHPAGENFFAPTVLADVDDDALIFREETFGPVAGFAPFDAEDEVLARANATETGLVAYLHTGDTGRAARLARALEFGMVAVNRTKITGAPVPFGGVKQAGLGREGSRHGMEAYAEIKYICRETD
jgi:acyl-CoA reductase-like NAD-dependent aldehyde dehydrogenase